LPFLYNIDKIFEFEGIISFETKNSQDDITTKLFIILRGIK